MFRWEADMIEELVKKIQSFKTKILFECKNFEADKGHQYSKNRKAMAKFIPVEQELFGPAEKLELSERLSGTEKQMVKLILKRK